MSLFKARDWWNTTCGADEEFDRGCLCIANIDNSPDGSAKIIVGSYNGILRIYKPQPIKLENGSYSDFRPDELLLETQLKSAIIQVQSGYLVSSTNLLHLAVLHPFKLCVYLVTVVPGAVEHGTYYNLSLVYEHNLQRHAFSLVLGPFGETKGKDLMCVQSLDGTLNFFEQESFAFSRTLPGTLIPGPITYVARTDSFVTASGYCVESYRFQVLAVATDKKSEDENENVKGKKVIAEWTYNIGEWARDVVTVAEKNQAPPVILILGEKTLFALNTNGTLRFAKKFNYNPCSFMAHNDGIDGSLIVLITTMNQTLLVYHEKCLKWAAQLPFRPVCIQRSTFLDVKGLIVLLSSEGDLACCYLGTEPSLFVSPITDSKEINFEEAEKEMQELKKLIKSSNQNLLGTHNLGNEVSISISMPYQVDAVNNSGGNESRTFGPVPTVTVKVQLKCITVVHDVRLMIHVDPPLKLSQNVFAFGSVADCTQAVVRVFLESSYVPSSLAFTAHAAYTSSQGAPRIFESTSLLPLSLIAKACQPAKSAEYRITIDINKKIISTADLFSDLSPDVSCFSGGAMGIEYYCGTVVTIMPSKSSQRYRLQSDDFSSLYLIISELIRRLKYKYRKDEEHEKLKCQYSTSLPLQEYFSIIQDNFEKRQEMDEMVNLLAQRSEQFRVVQKRLLTKMKDKTPTPLNNLDTLLEATHRHILTLSDSIEKHTVALQSATCSLSAATQLMLLLLKLSVEIKEDEYAFICACFSPSVDFDAVQGWEEKMNVALTYLLRYCLGNGENKVNMPDSVLEMPKDIAKLKKHIALVLDNIVKNGTVKITGSYIDENEEYQNDLEQAEADLDDDLIIPVGSKFAGTESNQDSNAQLSSHQTEYLTENVASNDTSEYPGEDDDGDEADLDDYPDNTDEMII